MAELSLAEQFPKVTLDEWRSMAETVLKGGSFDRLRSRTLDGVVIEPLYPPAPDRRELLGRRGAGWDIRTEHSIADAATLNAAILDDLEGGATSVAVSVPADADAAWFTAALDGVLLDVAAVHLRPLGDPVLAAGHCAEVFTRAGVTPVGGSFGADPLGRVATAGGEIDAARREMAAVAELSPPANVTLFAVDTSVYSGAGASEVQELAAALATGVAALRALDEHGRAIDEAAGLVEFILTADCDVFATMAKLRAFRRAWDHLLTSAGASASAAQPRLTVRQADRVLSRRDPWVNLLRGTAACVGAALGGADAVVVAPFDRVAGEPERLGRRMARNTQLLLLEEAHLGHVVDPGAGSGYIEALTDELCRLAWSAFVDIERAGGMASVLADGSFAAAVAAVGDERRRGIARRSIPLTGVSEFPNLDEEPLQREAASLGADSASDRPAGGSVSDGRGIDPFPVVPLDADFEALRAASDHHLDEHGHRPQIFLANLGPISAHTARSGWARNVFESGGIAALSNDGFVDPAVLADAFAASNAKLAVLCGDDATYQEWGESAAKSLRAAGATTVYLAGRAELAGVDLQIHVGTDVVEMLEDAHRALGIGR